MRKEFAESILKLCKKNKKIIFLTGDLGFMALEPIREILGERFINAGVAEQNMVGVAAGLAKQGFIPIVYSIAPFVTYRVLEQIRNDVVLHKLPVIIVGNGGGYGYGIMGATHHAIEDYGMLNTLKLNTFIPSFDEDVEETLKLIINSKKPAYLRLGSGIKPEWLHYEKYQPYRKILKGNKITIVAAGPVGINAIIASREFAGKIDLWLIGKTPINEIPEELISSIKKTGKLISIEEHVDVGGVGEQFVSKLLELGVNKFEIKRLTAQGYIDGKYGSQQYHQKQSGLDVDSIKLIIKEYLGDNLFSKKGGYDGI
ncbi:MAG: transketolase C-terminal domain-containing protein [Candidatus Gastranaerophilaceae bacterium]